METVIAVLIGLLFAMGLYLTMQKSLLRIIIGSALVSHGSLLAIMFVGGLNKGLAPILANGGGPYTDPIPQALNLTAIVIGFGLTAFQLVLAYRTYQEMGTDDLDELRHQEETGTHE